MTAQEAAEALEYWLDYPPTSNSDRYSMEQAARTVLTALRATEARELGLREMLRLVNLASSAGAIIPVNQTGNGLLNGVRDHLALSATEESA